MGKNKKQQASSQTQDAEFASEPGNIGSSTAKNKYQNSNQKNR